jgi:uncharacterized membrane protein YeaQ/YmgE (transglycosylase-associated protein family)
MLFLAWALVGMIFGLIGSRLVRAKDKSLLSPVLLAISGAVIGGLLFNLFGTTSWTGINLHSLIVSMAGALVFLTAYYSIKQAY